MYMDLLAGKKGIDEKEAGSNEDGKSFFLGGTFRS